MNLTGAAYLKDFSKICHTYHYIMFASDLFIKKGTGNDKIVRLGSGT